MTDVSAVRDGLPGVKVAKVGGHSNRFILNTQPN